jgi:hypothetical protein
LPIFGTKLKIFTPGWSFAPNSKVLLQGL